MVLGRGRDANRGNFVVLRHANGYVSQYFHLSRFAKRLRSGQRVEQGQIIGAVGSTGLSSGPHLHYGLLKNNRFLNPLRLQLPSITPLPKAAIPSFRKYCELICAPFSRPEPEFSAAARGIKIQPLPVPAGRSRNPK
jgi:murein DD-endopeptidase MepM/ murein hydrolase activator NlpD